MFKFGNNLVVFPEEGQMVAEVTDPVSVAHMKNLNTISTFPIAMMDRPGGALLIQLPWTEEGCRILQNMGIDTVGASPMYHATDTPLVEGKFKPLKHQLLTAAFLTLYDKSYVLSEPRLGKTGSIILAMDYLQRRRALTGGVLIITTYTTIHSVWASGIRETLPNAIVQIVHGPTRAADLQRPADFYVTNYESVRLDDKAFRDAVRDSRIGAVIIDELTHLGNPESKRSKAIQKLCQRVRADLRVVGITGSPADDPEAVYGMVKCVTPTRLPVTTKTAWRDLVMFKWGALPWQKDTRASASQTIFNTMQPAIRFKKSEVLDLPPVTEQVRSCELTKEQERHRDKLRVDALTIMANGEVITAANGGVLLQRLMQIYLGVIKGGDGKAIELDHAPRTQVILDAIAETNRKVVIFCSYIAGVRMLTKEIEAAGYTTAFIDGSVTGQKRAAILSDFQNAKDPHVLVCHPTTVGFGTELSAADTMIFANPLLLGGFAYTQALERLSSVRQKADNINIIHIVASQDERRILRRLQAGHSEAMDIAGLFEAFVKGND